MHEAAEVCKVARTDWMKHLEVQSFTALRLAMWEHCDISPMIILVVTVCSGDSQQLHMQNWIDCYSTQDLPRENIFCDVHST